MGSFEFLACPLWVNLLLLVPFVAYSLFRRGRPRLTGRGLFPAAIFALSFAFVEATVAIYLGAAVASCNVMLVRSRTSCNCPGPSARMQLTWAF
jgi:hypothetical protein